MPGWCRVALVAGAVLLAACGQVSAPDQLAKAKQSLQESRPTDAVLQLKNALQADPKLTEARLLLGKTLLETGDAVGAEIELKKALESGASEEEVLPLLAQAMLGRGQFDRLVADLDSADLKLASARADLKSSIAMALLASGRLDAAREALRVALEADARNPSARLVQARMTALDGGIPSALGMVDSVVAESPKAVPALLLRAQLLAANGADLEDVKTAYRRVLEVEARNLTAHFALIQIGLQFNDLAGAEAQLTALKKEHPKNPMTAFAGALISLQKGDLAVAHEKAQALLKIAPDDPRVNRLAGSIAFQRGNSLQASVALGKALALAGGDWPEGRVMLARSQMLLGDPSRALTTLRPVLESRQVSTDARLAAAEAYLQLGDSSAASALFKKAAESDPSNARARTAVVLSRVGLDPMAETEQALQQIGAGDSGVMSEMALISLRLSKRQFAEALQAVDAYEAKQKGKPLPAMLRGRIELMRGQPAPARKHFEMALARDAGYVPAVMALAGLDVREGKRPDAIQRLGALVDRTQGGVLQAEMALIGLKADGGAKAEELVPLIQQAVKRHPGEVQPRLALIRAQLQAKQAKDALTSAQEAYNAFPTDPAVLEALSRAHQALGDMAQAQAAAGKLTTLLPQSPGPAVLQAELAMAQGDVEAARQYLQKSLTIKADHLPGQVALVGLWLKRGKMADARAIAAAVQKQRPKEPVGWLLMADIERAAGARLATASALREAFVRKEDASTAVMLYGALEAAGQRQEAGKFSQDWLAKHPKDVLLRMAIAERTMAQKAWPDAERQLEEVLTLQADNAVALNNLAWVKHQQGKADALTTVERALKLAPKAAPFLDTQAMILAAQGQMDAALAAQRQSVDADPANHLHRLHLAQMLVQAKRIPDARKELDVLAKLGEQSGLQDEVRALRSKIDG